MFGVRFWYVSCIEDEDGDGAGRRSREIACTQIIILINWFWWIFWFWVHLACMFGFSSDGWRNLFPDKKYKSSQTMYCIVLFVYTMATPCGHLLHVYLLSSARLNDSFHHVWPEGRFRYIALWQKQSKNTFVTTTLRIFATISRWFCELFQSCHIFIWPHLCEFFFFGIYVVF